MKKLLVLLACTLPTFSWAQQSHKVLVWADEFNYQGVPDASKWTLVTGGHGWGNAEKQFYTQSEQNAFVSNGHLHLVAKNEKYQGSEFTSARMVTKGKADFTYGRFEVKAKLPGGKGTWPAIWMLASQEGYGTQFWPDNGEIDIMEHVGFDPNVVHGNIHTKSFNHSIKTNLGNRVTVPNTQQEFHVYACEWTENKITVEVDGQVYFTFEKKPEYTWKEWPFDKPFHLILNIAVGGNWGGQQGIDPSIFPQEMIVDYVRVYRISADKH
ncbi:MAG: family 16 glycosylhydrolase [Spirosomataceae bacterium]